MSGPDLRCILAERDLFLAGDPIVTTSRLVANITELVDYIRELENRAPPKQNEEAMMRTCCRVLFGAVLDLLQGDPHSWSTRGCSTCRAIGSIVGVPFGCEVYAAARAQKKP